MTLITSHIKTMEANQLWAAYDTGANSRIIAQTFPVTITHSVASVKLWLSKCLLPGTVTIGIQALVAGLPSDVFLCSTDINGNDLPENPPVDPVWTEITFSSPATLTAGNSYAIVVTAPDGNNLNAVNVCLDKSVSYSGGAMYENRNAAGWLSQNADFIFETYSSDTAVASMTVGNIISRGNKSKMRSVTFTHSDVANAAETATTTFSITGRLLKYTTVGGDAEWQFSLNDGTATIFSSGNLNGSSSAVNTGLLRMHATVPHKGIAMAGQALTCTTANVSDTDSGTAPTITIFWEESANR
jgi:hypothetical protein